MLNKFRLWLIAHGIEFEGGTDINLPREENSNRGNICRHFCIVINHRYYGFEVAFLPFKGVYKDELNTSHAEIAAQRQRWDGEDRQKAARGEGK